MEERLIPMNEILPGTKEWKCKVRVIKKQEPKQANNNPNKFQKLILGDGLGHTLDAVIFHDNIDRFKHVLQEGNVYMVKGAYVSDPKQYRNPIVTCNYQWTFRKDTSVNEEPNDSIPAGGLSFRTTPSYEFHKFLSTKTLINTACVIIGTHEPRVVTVKGQGKVIREYAAIDTELETFVVTFWETSVSDEIYAKLEPISNRTPLLLLNFSVVPYYGLSLTTNAQSIVLDSSENEMLIELERWKQENEEAINMLVQTGGFFEKKVLRSPKQPLQITKVEQMLQNQENTYFNVKVKARLENEYQDYFYIGCPICSTKTVASYDTEFMCYSTPCKNMRIANRSFRFSLMVFDASGQVEVTFLGKEAQKLLGLDPSEFYEKQNQGPIMQMDFLRQRLCNIVLLLKIKSRIFKDVCTFTADAIEILQDDGAIPSEKISIEPEVHLEQDNDKVIRAKIAAKAKGKGKVSQESHIEHIKDTIGSSFKDSLSSDDDKPISEIFRGKKKICSIVLSEDSSNDSLNCVVESVERGNIGKIKRRFVSKRKKVVHLDLSEDSDDVDTPENFDDAYLDMPLSDEFVERATDCKLVEDSHMESCLPLAGTLYHEEKQDLVAKTSKKTKITQAKDKQVAKAKKAKKMKSNILKDKIQSISDSSHQLSEVVIEHNKGKRVPQTPTLKSRSGRTIKRRILD